MKFKFKDDAEANIGSEDPFYALTKGGYLKPESVLADAEQAKAVRDAANLVESFIDACYKSGAIEEE